MRIATSIIVVSLIALAGCGSTMPPKELVDARVAYSEAARGPAAQENPAGLHTAQQALNRAETSFSEDGDNDKTRALSYVAIRKAELAESYARTSVAMKRKESAELEARQLQRDNLRTAQGELAETKSSLAKTQAQLESEKQAREEADKKAQQAAADLKKIAAVKQEPRGMVITLSGSVVFATNEATLLPGAVNKINEVADALLRGNPDSNITVEGHTDSTGERGHNMDLSRRRAEAVKAQLVARGVASDRIKTAGVGPERPVADNKSAEGRANNRRVEIIVEPSRRSGGQGNGSMRP